MGLDNWYRDSRLLGARVELANLQYRLVGYQKRGYERSLPLCGRLFREFPDFIEARRVLAEVRGFAAGRSIPGEQGGFIDDEHRRLRAEHDEQLLCAFEVVHEVLRDLVKVPVRFVFICLSFLFVLF